MDIDAYVIGTLLDQQDPKQLKGIKREYFDGDWAEVWDFVLNFVKDHGKLPRIETVAGKMNVEVEVGSEPMPYYAGELRNRAMKNAIANGLREEVFIAIDQEKVGDAYKGLKKVVAGVSRDFFSRVETGAVSLKEGIQEAAAYYRERKALKGLLGLPTPWPTLTRVTGGWQGGDMIVLTARPEVGKTWLALIIAIFTALQGFRVLFASMEMKPKKMRIRADALGARISSDRFRRGVLSSVEEQRLKLWFKRCMSDSSLGDLFLYGQSDIESAVDLELKIQEDKPDLVVWDSYYRAAESPDWKDMVQLTRSCKTIAEREDINVPVILVTQLKRSVKKGDKRADTTDLAFTQAIEHEADIILSIFRTLEMENLMEMLMRSIKIRDGIKLKELLIRWDLDNMNFQEIYATYTGGKSGESYDNTEK